MKFLNNLRFLRGLQVLWQNVLVFGTSHDCFCLDYCPSPSWRDAALLHDSCTTKYHHEYGVVWWWAILFLGQMYFFSFVCPPYTTAQACEGYRMSLSYAESDQSFPDFQAALDTFCHFVFTYIFDRCPVVSTYLWWHSQYSMAYLMFWKHSSLVPFSWLVPLHSEISTHTL